MLLSIKSNMNYLKASKNDKVVRKKERKNLMSVLICKQNLLNLSVLGSKKYIFTYIYEYKPTV